MDVPESSRTERTFSEWERLVSPASDPDPIIPLSDLDPIESCTNTGLRNPASRLHHTHQSPAFLLRACVPLRRGTGRIITEVRAALSLRLLVHSCA